MRWKAISMSGLWPSLSVRPAGCRYRRVKREGSLNAGADLADGACRVLVDPSTTKDEPQYGRTLLSGVTNLHTLGHSQLKKNLGRH